MSLLLEALKKAERAKEEAQRRARGEGASAAPAAEPSAAERRPVVTRDKLPQITAPLEIVTEDLVAPPTPPTPRPPLEIAPEPEPAKPAARPRAGPARAQTEAASRASARKVFEAKFREPNPRLPFYVTLGVLGVFALGTLVYFWVQLRPPPALVNLNPARQAEANPPIVETRQPAPTPVAVAAPSGIPGLPASAAKNAANAPAPVAAPIAPRASVEAPVETPRLRAPEPRRIAPALPALPEGAATVSRNPPQVNAKVAAGYAAYAAGDLGGARSAYEEALREEPTNRDALLGLAALEVRSARYESAEALYLRALQIDPRDGDTQAALIALRSGRSDPLVTESRVKTLIAADPSAHALHFTLGNQLAAQNRWAEAQQEYFKAYIADPENADFAYNLAVSLDHLHQRRQALEYYQRAISLGEKRGAGFDLTSARARAAQLAL
ncbi:MAG TPA: tetratricopeptide repeat protein [Burkholderiales bacterium]|nr:tetratricopeptide repeat protein [Burkholderiales bacterium]